MELDFEFIDHWESSSIANSAAISKSKRIEPGKQYLLGSGVAGISGRLPALRIATPA